MVYSKSLNEHVKHLHAVLEVFRKESLYTNLKKCTFYTNQVALLRYVVCAQGINVDQNKVKAIEDWPMPTNVSDVRSFYGLASFYQELQYHCSPFDVDYQEK